MAETESGKRVTLADVAAAAGVSPAAVSLAVRGEPGVSEETRRRIVETARRLGYRTVNRWGSRRSRQTTIGLVIKAPQGDAPKANRFYAPVMAGIEESCRLRSVDLLLATMPVDADYHPIEVPRLVAERATDGLIVVGAHLSRGTTELLEDGPPVLLVDAYAEDAAFDSVVSDDVGGARAAVEHLIAKGHRAIAIVGSHPGSFPSILQRRRGYEQAMTEAGLQPHFADGPHVPPEVGAAAGLDYVCAHPEITAVFCCNDDVAVAFSQSAQRTGIVVPDAMSVVGYDDIDLAAFVTPRLTTMAVDKIGMGHLAVTLLLHRLELGSAAVTQTLIRPRLVERESVATRLPSS
ncbi:MAG TPA: LacI family DNA-binding transcriptional regulator [Candidatus Limnocylindrales bacterium]|nr:LacI family DNA-binding transcriptional regulator [Candidatus Limnocylindrales bacterium]